MAQVRLTRVPGIGGTLTFRAEFSRLGPDLPRKPVLRAVEMLNLSPGDPDFVPQGVEHVQTVHRVQPGHIRHR